MEGACPRGTLRAARKLPGRVLECQGPADSQRSRSQRRIPTQVTLWGIRQVRFKNVKSTHQIWGGEGLGDCCWRTDITTRSIVVILQVQGG